MWWLLLFIVLDCERAQCLFPSFSMCNSIESRAHFFLFSTEWKKSTLLSIAILLCRPKQTEPKKKKRNTYTDIPRKKLLLSICLLVFNNTENQLPFKAIYILVVNISHDDRWCFVLAIIIDKWFWLPQHMRAWKIKTPNVSLAVHIFSILINQSIAAMQIVVNQF